MRLKLKNVASPKRKFLGSQNRKEILLSEEKICYLTEEYIFIAITNAIIQKKNLIRIKLIVFLSSVHIIN